LKAFAPIDICSPKNIFEMRDKIVERKDSSQMSDSSLEDVSAFIKIPKEVKFIPNSHKISEDEENSIIF
jgi:hypothetical protein